MTIGEKIKYLRTKNNLSQEALAKELKITKQAIYKYENGIVTNIPMDKITLLAKILHTTPEYLMGWKKHDFLPQGARHISHKRFPMLGNVACGEPIFADEDREMFIEVDTDINADFCLTAKGDSMINARIFNGDILFVKRQPTVEDGEIAVVLIEDEATVKRVYYNREDNIITLLPENPLYKPMRYTGEQLNNIRIIGKVIIGQYTVN